MKPNKQKFILFSVICTAIVLFSLIITTNLKLIHILKHTYPNSNTYIERFEIIKKDLTQLKKDIRGMKSTYVPDSKKNEIINSIDKVIESMDNEYTYKFYYKVDTIASEIAYDSTLYMDEAKAKLYSTNFSYMLNSYLKAGYISSREFESLSKHYQSAINEMILNKLLIDLNML